MFLFICFIFFILLKCNTNMFVLFAPVGVGVFSQTLNINQHFSVIQDSVEHCVRSSLV